MQIRIRIAQTKGPLPGKRTVEGDIQSKISNAAPSSSPRSRIVLGASSRVALGILVSRLTGLIRERIIAHYFGIETLVADAFRAAVRIPNLLSNLFGEGVLSASFVTVYSKLLATAQEEEAEHLASAVFGILSVLCAVLVAVGVLVTPALIDLIAPGFHGEKRTLTVQIVRILFPGTGLLVLSAWCLGVLNSHRRFLLSYTAPVVLNATVVVAAIAWGASPQNRLVLDVAWAYVAGSGLQFLVQLPRVLKLLPGFRPVFETHSEHVRSTIRNFGPIFVSRGVVQLSAYIDSMIASWLPTGAVSALGSGQVISVLPISLFSMSVSAAELPALSSAVGSQEEVALYLKRRLSTGLRRIAFFVVPSAVAFLVLGDIVAAALYQSGRVRHSEAVYLWSVLAGSAVGLLATGLGRLYSSAFYALLDTKTPLRFAVIRVALTVALGLLFALEVPRWIGIHPKWGAAGLTASAGIAGWVEFALLRRALGKRIGRTPLPAAFTAKLWSVAFVAAAVAFLVKQVLGTGHPLVIASVALPLYGVIYFGGTALASVEESKSILDAIWRRVR